MLDSILPFYLIPFLIYMVAIVLSMFFTKNVRTYVLILIVLFTIFVSYLIFIAWLKPWMN